MGHTNLIRSYRSVRGFTLIELIIVVAITGTLSVLVISAWGQFRGAATRADCSNNLRQLGAAVGLYVAENNNCFPPYLKFNSDGTRTWYFGKESTPPGTAEGDRDLDVTQGPLYPFIEEVGVVEVCKAFNYSTAIWKPKFRGASYGYGYNWILGGLSGGSPMNVTQVSSGARTILFGDCAQVNTFQLPASPTNPKLEEFYIINETDKTIHFRHNGKANILFVDGHVESFAPYPGTIDTRIKSETLGRITKRGSTEMLK